MEVSCVLIEENMRDDFESVFPSELNLSDTRVAVAAVDDEDFILGAISYEVVNYEYHIDWLFVEPSYRRMGIGTFLIDQVLRAVMQTGERLPVTARFELEEDNEELYFFFLSNPNMTLSYSHERYYVNNESIRSSSILHRAINTTVKRVPFFKKTINEQKSILHMLSQKETYTVTDYDRWKEGCVHELCQCVYVNNNLVDLIFMKKLPGGNLELSYLYGKYPRGLMELLSDIVSKIETLYPQASLTFEAISEEAQNLADNLFPKAKAVHVYEAEF